ncbi:AzlC family ABC transporter permease [Bacteroidetes bacterium endosymbiont of Geopemphigus sp.]|uniref:AzlC family ABC transporter permease n=1 Tax=Bacteroidetes bacterium endosymbiont of Geopemphigus sp. TaxID=2047937 RepID=UPI0018A7F45B
MLIAFLPFGLLLEVQFAQKSLSALGLGMITGLNFVGGSEFAEVTLWTSPLQVITILLVSKLINSRYIIMGASFAPTSIIYLPERRFRYCLLCVMKDDQ